MEPEIEQITLWLPGSLTTGQTGTSEEKHFTPMQPKLPEILFITSYPPRECGLATYSQDLIKAINNKFSDSFKIKICPLESKNEQHIYSDEIQYFLNTDHTNAFTRLAHNINTNPGIQMILLQHEFGLFENKQDDLIRFLNALAKPVCIVFHTVLPHPNPILKAHVIRLAEVSRSIIVMTNSSAGILMNDYKISPGKISVIAHGTHLVPHSDKEVLKKKYNFSGRMVLSTFGLLSSGKNIETTLHALPEIIKQDPTVLFLIIGKTHPSVVKSEGEKYRKMLTAKVAQLELGQHVKFVNHFLPLPSLLEYLQLSDIYLFTSKDPNQAVSGTFSYAISCGCPIISTPIPHAREVLGNDGGVIIDFENSNQLAEAVVHLLKNEPLRKNISSHGLHRMASTSWENAAIAHARLFETIIESPVPLRYKLPRINLDHVKKMTTGFGMIQFSRIDQPDIDSGYTLDDNARALVALCQHFELTREETDLKYINIYFDFIRHCQQPQGYFLNYADEHKNFTDQNNSANLADSNGRAIWALGYVISQVALLPSTLVASAEEIFERALPSINNIHSTRAMAFTIKGLYYSTLTRESPRNLSLIKKLGDRLVQMYRHEAEPGWAWFESYLTYANSILPEAMLCAWLATGEPIYKEIAKVSFDFLLSKTFRNSHIKVISNKGWLQKGAGSNASDMEVRKEGGEQPIDVAYTILALRRFYDTFGDTAYLRKMRSAFDWFLGHNHLNQIIYNPCTGGCYDGLEENNVNLNQGAESTVSYLMARLVIEKPAKTGFTAPAYRPDSVPVTIDRSQYVPRQLV